MQQIGFFIAELTVRSTCFGHHYAHHQELKSYTDGCCLWYLAFWFTGRWSCVELCVMCPVCGMLLLVWCGVVGYVSGLRDAAVGLVWSCGL